jgi:hypothetical protein
VAAYGGALVAISPETLAVNNAVVTDGLVDEVFTHLRAQGLLLPTNTRGRTILAGHSRGGEGAVAEAAQHEPGSGAPVETANGLFLFDPVVEAIPRAIALVQRRLAADLARLTTAAIPADQINYLRTDGYMLRAFGLDPSYAGDVRQIQRAIDAFFAANSATLPTDATVMTNWRRNYQVILVPAPDRRDDRHSSMVSTGAGGPIWNRDYTPQTGHLEQSLNDWRTQHL